MADKQTTRPHGDQPGQGAGRSDRALDSAEPRDLDVAEVALAMSDLIADDQGEVVLFNDSELRRLVVTTDAAVVSEGRSGAHRTSAGEDVDGFSFVTFDNGVTLYYQAGLDLAVRSDLD